MTELWSTLPNLSRYHVSTRGRVGKFRFDGSIKIFSSKPTTSGYISVNLINDSNKRNSYRVHRLVAMAFIPNPENKPIVDHINGDRTDNRMSNLRWVTAEENSQGKKQATIFKTREVVQYDLDGNVVKVWESMISIKREIGLSAGQ